MKIITKFDCEKILLKELEHLKFDVQEFEVVKFGDFLGFLGEYYTVVIHAEVDGKFQSFQYFMKTLPEGKDKELQVEQGFHAKEVFIYKEIFNKIIRSKSSAADSWCPKYFLSNNDALVLEDLSLKNYKILPFGYKFKQSHMEEALKMLARFHSCSIAYNDKNPGKTIGEIYDKTFVDKSFIASNPWLQNGFRTVEQLATKYETFENVQKSFSEKFHETFERMHNPSVENIKVLCHADLWKNNLMFKFDDEKNFDYPLHCVLLDFQVAKYIPLQIDVLMVIILNTKKDHRENLLEHYLKFYYENLEDELLKVNVKLEPKISFSKFKESCEYFKHVALVYNAIATMITHVRPERFSQMTPEEYEAFTISDRIAIVKRLMKEDEFYAESVTESVESLVEYFRSEY